MKFGKPVHSRNFYATRLSKLNELDKDFVIIPADKAANNIVVI